VTEPEEPAAELTRAVRAGDVSTARKLLEEHSGLRSGLDQPMYDGHFGATLLIAAVQTGHREMVELLLGAGAGINQRSHWWAGGFGVLDGESELVSWLIARGARVDACAAARHGMMDRLRSILEADPGAARMRGGDGQTPLHVARTVEIAAYLLEHGAEIDALDVDHESTPAQYLVRDRPEVARFLVSRGCRTDLLLAAALGDLELARRHLEQDPGSTRLSVSLEDFPKRDLRAGGTIYIWTLGWNKTPHLVAREFGHQALFNFLMERSPEVMQLAMACELGDQATAQRLVARRPDLVRSLGEAERRRLPAAAVDNDLPAVRRLLAAGWPLDARANEGATALHWAAFHGNAEMVGELLRHGADPTLRDRSYDGTALNWARYGSEHGWHPERGNYAATIEALK
jgi:ankyrin repeat protein